ncbi:helix-turn-helix domain-containing protein [Peribacillus frigoritolerans]|uniref:helix-turn-helix domain-containing protein n=2 Tax=Peribacillus frigoritolerans TaxID=450367 RepID=UPI00399F0FFB
MMLEHFGQQIRQLRVRKGKGLNEFAKELHVSAGYLSNLETGKSDNIKLDVLEKIQKELKVLPLDTTSSFSQRLKQIEQNISELEKNDPLYAEFLIHNLETSIEWIKEKKK